MSFFKNPVNVWRIFHHTLANEIFFRGIKAVKISQKMSRNIYGFEKKRYQVINKGNRTDLMRDNWVLRHYR
ncbi:unnamed protein product [Schistosoma turkestanicum]|nr:unnamed protein product [Schistosoma turkestanicum]